MAPPMKHIIVCIVVMVMLAMVDATPPGIANHPSQSKCTGKYKICNNLEHVCPKFCPNGCTTDCVSCKPVCIGETTVPSPSTPDSDPDSPPSTPPTPTLPTTPSTPEYDTKSPPPTPLAPTLPTPTPEYDTKSPPPTPPTPTLPITPSTPEYDTKSPPPTPLTPTPPTSTSTPEYDTKSPPPTPLTPTPPTTPPKPEYDTKSPPPTPLTPTLTTTPPTPEHDTESPPPTPMTPTPPSPTSTPPPTHPSTPTPTTPSPYYPPSTSGKKRVRCKNKNYGQCYNVEHVCPNACPRDCLIDCVSCKPVCSCDMPGAVCQDPRLIGGDGITFYFHGKKDADFCLVSDSNIHINGHFIGKRNPNMTRDFTWVQSIGILFGTHKLFVGAQKTATWNEAIDRLALAFDNEPIFLPNKQGAMWKSEITPSVYITRMGDTNAVTVEVEGNFKITAKVVPITEEDSRVHNYGVTKDDVLAHLDLGFKFYSLSDQVNGVLGQTYGPNYASQIKVGVTMPVMGGEKKFSSSTIFSTDCAVAQFNGEASPLTLETANLSCGSGMDGKGVVCKR